MKKLAPLAITAALLLAFFLVTLTSADNLPNVERVHWVFGSVAAALLAIGVFVLLRAKPGNDLRPLRLLLVAIISVGLVYTGGMLLSAVLWPFDRVLGYNIFETCTGSVTAAAAVLLAPLVGRRLLTRRAPPAPC